MSFWRNQSMTPPAHQPWSGILVMPGFLLPNTPFERNHFQISATKRMIFEKPTWYTERHWQHPFSMTFTYLSISLYNRKHPLCWDRLGTRLSKLTSTAVVLWPNRLMLRSFSAGKETCFSAAWPFQDVSASRLPFQWDDHVDICQTIVSFTCGHMFCPCLSNDLCRAVSCIHAASLWVKSQVGAMRKWMAGHLRHLASWYLGAKISEGWRVSLMTTMAKKEHNRSRGFCHAGCAVGPKQGNLLTHWKAKETPLGMNMNKT